MSFAARLAHGLLQGSSAYFASLASQQERDRREAAANIAAMREAALSALRARGLDPDGPVGSGPRPSLVAVPDASLPAGAPIRASHEAVHLADEYGDPAIQPAGSSQRPVSREPEAAATPPPATVVGALVEEQGPALAPAPPVALVERQRMEAPAPAAKPRGQSDESPRRARPAQVRRSAGPLPPVVESGPGPDDRRLAEAEAAAAAMVAESKRLLREAGLATVHNRPLPSADANLRSDGIETTPRKYDPLHLTDNGGPFVTHTPPAVVAETNRIFRGGASDADMLNFWVNNGLLHPDPREAAAQWAAATAELREARAAVRSGTFGGWRAGDVARRPEPPPQLSDQTDQEYRAEILGLNDPDGPAASAHHPDLSERIGRALGEITGGDTREGARDGRRFENFLRDLTPVGAVDAYQDFTARRDRALGEGRVVDALGNEIGRGAAVLAVLPIGRAPAKAGRYVIDRTMLEAAAGADGPVDAARAGRMLRGAADDALARGGTVTIHTPDGPRRIVGPGLVDEAGDAWDAGQVLKGGARVEIDLPRGVENRTPGAAGLELAAPGGDRSGEALRLVAGERRGGAPRAAGPGEDKRSPGGGPGEGAAPGTSGLVRPTGHAGDPRSRPIGAPGHPVSGSDEAAGASPKIPVLTFEKGMVFIRGLSPDSRSRIDHALRGKVPLVRRSDGVWTSPKKYGSILRQAVEAEANRIARSMLPKGTPVPIDIADAGSVVDESGATLIRKGFKTEKEAQLWARSKRRDIDPPAYRVAPFGDRFAIVTTPEGRPRGLGAADDVAPVKPGRTVSSIEEARAAARQLIGKEEMNEYTGFLGTITGNSVGKMTSGKAVYQSPDPAAHAYAVANIDQLFRIARLEKTVADRANSLHVAGFHLFTAPMLLNGRVYTVSISAKEMVHKGTANPLYSVEILGVGRAAPTK